MLGTADLSSRALRATFRIIAAVPLAFGILLVAPSASRADPCPVTDPSCAIGTVTSTAGDVVDAGTDTVDDVGQAVDDATGDATDDVTDTVGDVTSTATETVTQIVDDTVDAARGAIDTAQGAIDTAQGAIDPLTAGGNPDEQPGSTPAGGNASGHHGGSDGRVLGGTRDATASIGSPAPRALVGTTPAATPVAPVSLVARKTPSVGDWIARGIGGSARVLVFPMLLAAIVAAFVLVQNRLDRRTPELALAPIGPDVLTFA